MTDLWRSSANWYIANTTCFTAQRTSQKTEMLRESENQDTCCQIVSFIYNKNDAPIKLQ